MQTEFLYVARCIDKQNRLTSTTEAGLIDRIRESGLPGSYAVTKQPAGDHPTPLGKITLTETGGVSVDRIDPAQAAAYRAARMAG